METLRILIANEGAERLRVLEAIVHELGHEVVGEATDVRSVGPLTARVRPDVALVWLGLSSDHALAMIEQIVQESTCPVIALLSASEPAYVREAAKRGVFAYIVDTSPEDLQSALEITLHRFSEYHKLQGAFGRRAVIEQAKGVLMGRHGIDADAAFAMLRDQSQHTGQKLADLATALVSSHRLLAKPPRPPEDV